MTTLRRRPCALFGILLLWCSGLTLAAEAATTPLLLHDFERAVGAPNSGGAMSGWTTESSRRTGRIWYRLEPAAGPDRSRALQLRYRYDHLEFWIRGDKAAGYAKDLKIEFKQPLPNAPPGLLRQGSTVVAGITGDWQRIRVPLNLMNGIADWRHLRQFGIVLQPRRSPVHAGAYWLDDIALIKTGQPGPSSRDPVVPPQKTACCPPTIRRFCGDWRAIPGAGWRR